MFPSRSRLAIWAFCCFATPATWAATSLPAFKVDPRLLGLPPLPDTQPATPVPTPPLAPTAPVAKPEPAPQPPASITPAPKSAPIAPSTEAAPQNTGTPLPPPAPAAPVPLDSRQASPVPAETAPKEASIAPPTPVTPASVEPPLSPLQLTNALPKSRPGSDEPTPAFVSAARIQGHQEREIEAEGDVEIRKLGLRINADSMRYDTPTDELLAKGNVRLENQGALARGPELQYNLSAQAGQMNQPSYLLASAHGRGQADKAEFLSKNEMRLTNASYTTCSPGVDDWFIRAGELEINRTTQEGVARHARVEFMGVPLLYTPWIDFPLDNQRKSGLLAPSFGTSGNNGSELTLPFYWNIAPNYDATISPRWMQKRGLQLGGEFRYLQHNYSGIFQGEYLPSDNITHTDRNAVNFQHAQNFGHGLIGSLNLQHVSDNNYYRDLSTLVAKTSQSLLPQEGTLAYAAGGLSLVGRVQRYQVLQDPLAPIIAPYERRPQITLNYNKLDFLASDLRVLGEYTDFRNGNLVSGKRLVANPSISLPLSRSYGYITPKIGVHYTRYSLDNATLGLPDVTGTVRTYTADTTRTLPIYSLDSGLMFERDSSLFGNAMAQTLEPRLYYLYVPYKDQSNLPSFDSGEADFNFAQIFSENRFSGNDRISDANQLTLALTSRYIEPGTGQERLRAMIGQRINFTTPRVTLVAAAPHERRSDFLASLGGLIAPGWSLDSAWEYNPNEKQTQRYNIGGRYAPEPGKVANLSYRFNRDTLRQVDASTQWPLTAQWHALARWNYSIQDGRTLEGLVGLEYSRGCWALRLVGHRLTTATQQANNAIFIQLELSGLGNLGSNPLSLLRQSITGYDRLKPQLGEYHLEDY